MTRFARRSFLAFRGSCLVAVAAVAILCLVPARAATFIVLNTSDSIPAPPGSLRAAVEQSEVNGEADFITFLVDGGTIELVAPLPALTEGSLEMGRPRLNSQPTISNGIAISGANGVPYAIRVRSAKNVIANFDFVDFTGPEVVLIDGAAATGNLISGCVFGRDDGTGTNAGAAIRIVADLLFGGMPSSIEIQLSRFVRNGFGVVIDGAGSVPVDRIAALVHDNWFGTDPLGAAGPGTGEAIRARDAGRVLVYRNRFSGPGGGILLEQGSDRSTVSDNHLGLRNSSSTDCAGFASAAIRVQGSSQVEVSSNVILCSQSGVSLGPGTSGTVVRGNTIGGPAPAGLLSHGIVLDAAGTAVIRNNTIRGSGGFGISETNSPGIDPSGAVISCNAIFGNGAGAMNLPSVVTPPPVLTSATPIAVAGTVADDGPGWVEVFGDDLDEARVFQGSTRVPLDVGGFTHAIPVLGLELSKGPGGTSLDFDRSLPPNHTSTLTPEAQPATTELSSSIVAAPGALFDVIRGDLKNLAPGASGGVSLGPVVCLGEDVDPVTPTIVDPVDPNPGDGFFYVVRRDDPLSNANGVYDPAICSLDAGTFNGPRRPTSGDCD